MCPPTLIDLKGSIIDNANLLLLILGVFGVGLLASRKDRNSKCIFLYFISLLALLTAWMIAPETPIFKLFQADHLLGDLRSILFISAGLLVAAVLLYKPSNLSKARLPIALVSLIICLIISFNAFGETKEKAEAIQLYPYDLPAITHIEKKFPASAGRILVEDPYNRHVFRANSHLFAASPAFTDRELIGAGDWWFQKNDLTNIFSENLFNGSLNKTTDATILRRLELYNVEFIAAFSNELLERLSRLPLQKRLQSDYVLPLAIVDVAGLDAPTSGAKVMISWRVFSTNITPSYFYLSSGTKIKESYRKTKAEVDVQTNAPAILNFKVRYWPNWHAWIDDTPLPVQTGELGIMEVSVPKGRHTIRFEYNTALWDWTGLTLSIAGLLACLILLYDRKR